MSFDERVLVVGGGVVGLATAVALQRAGRSVTVVDPMSGQPASWGNAGHLAVEHVEPLASPHTLRTFAKRLFVSGGPLDFVWRDIGAWLPWSLEFLRASTQRRFERSVRVLETMTAQAIPAWRRLLAEDFADLICESGHIEIGPSQPDPARRTGVATCRPLSAPERGSVYSAIGREAHGLRFSGTAQVRDPGAVLSALRSILQASGGKALRAGVTTLRRAGTAWAAKCNDGTELSAGAVVVAAGAWSRPLLAEAGLPAPLIAERGYHIGFVREDWPEGLPPVVLVDRAVVVTRFAFGMRATSFVEFGRPDSPPDPRKWERLERDLRAAGILRGGPVTRWMGARPTLPDYLPAIGGDEVAGLSYAVGHSHLGLTLAAITAELLRDRLLGVQPAIDLAPFSLQRFSPTAAGKSWPLHG